MPWPLLSQLTSHTVFVHIEQEAAAKKARWIESQNPSLAEDPATMRPNEFVPGKAAAKELRLCSLYPTSSSFGFESNRCVKDALLCDGLRFQVVYVYFQVLLWP